MSSKDSDESVSHMIAARINTSWSFINAFIEAGFKGFEHILLPSGMEMNFLDSTMMEKLDGHFFIENSPIEFSFHLSGYGHGILNQTKNHGENLSIEPGKAILSYNPDSKCRLFVRGRQYLRVLNIYVSPKQLYNLLEGDLKYVPVKLRPIIEKNTTVPFNYISNITPAARILLDQIYHNPFKGVFRKIFFETKCMELIIRQLWELSVTSESKTIYRLSCNEMEKIRLARDILINEMEDPPSLKALAKKAGINDTMLKRGFRVMFGETVYGYLRMRRMMRSIELLGSGRLNVDETAHTLGFHDTAHFIRQFKRNYGTTPGAYLKHVKASQSVGAGSFS